MYLKYIFICKIFKPVEITARLSVVSVNRYIKLTFLLGPIRFTVGRWSKSWSYKFRHSTFCYLWYSKTVISEHFSHGFSIIAITCILYFNYFC